MQLIDPQSPGHNSTFISYQIFVLENHYWERLLTRYILHVKCASRKSQRVTCCLVLTSTIPPFGPSPQLSSTIATGVLIIACDTMRDSWSPYRRNLLPIDFLLSFYRFKFTTPPSQFGRLRSKKEQRKKNNDSVYKIAFILFTCDCISLSNPKLFA